MIAGRATARLTCRESAPCASNLVPFSQHLTKSSCVDCQFLSPIHCRHGRVLFYLRRFQATWNRSGETLMLKFVVLGIASLAFVGTAVAADLPRPQPQPQPVAAPVGKYPLGKYPVGKSPVGKYPVA